MATFDEEEIDQKDEVPGKSTKNLRSVRRVRFADTGQVVSTSRSKSFDAGK